MTQSTRLMEIVGELRERLTPAGWDVALVDHHTGWYELRFLHPLSSGLSYTFPANTDRDIRADVDRFLEGEAEYAEIGKFPTRPRHPHVLLAIRSAALDHEWSPRVVAEFGWLLARLDVLDHEEAEWLAQFPALPLSESFKARMAERRSASRRQK